MATQTDSEEKVGLRLNPDDSAALDWLQEYMTRTFGAGVRISRPDVCRWAIHTAKAGLEQEQQGE